MPNSKAQEDLIRRTYKNAGLSPHETTYFEAHGTGTAAGDPRETRAIGAVFAAGRDEPLPVGSVKSNIGHLEGASGLAGIIKTIMQLEKGKILPNMHFNNPNPNIDFENWKITVPTKVIDWKPVNGLRRASVVSLPLSPGPVVSLCVHRLNLLKCRRILSDMVDRTRMSSSKVTILANGLTRKSN